MNANGGKYGAGIGGGAMGAGENITISDGAHVTANGGAQGAGIGGGSGIGGNGSNITISGDKTYVEATGGGDAEAAGAGIGGGFSGRYGNVGKGSDITIEEARLSQPAVALPAIQAVERQVSAAAADMPRVMTRLEMVSISTSRVMRM